MKLQLVLLSFLFTGIMLGLVGGGDKLHAQTPEISATATPAITPTPTPASTGTVALIPAAGRLDATALKALIRARILMLIQARLQSSATPAATIPMSATETISHTVAIPLVINGAASGADAATVDTPAPPPPTATPTAVTVPLNPTPDGAPRTAQVPILMYHYLSTPPADADIYRRDLSVSPDLFAQHLDQLQAEGYTTIRLDDLLLHLTEGAPLPAKPVILTFDDGYRDNYTNAFPLLKERGMTATFFIVTDFIDEERPDYLSWDMVREMDAGGMSIQSHGRNHASLQGRDDDYLIWQALGSLETIEYELGTRPRFISYPAGQYDENTIRIFQSAHYWAGVTTVQSATHRSDDLFQLRRVRVRGATSADELSRLLKLDW